jgi:uncharacterized protein (TIGR02597 family)
MIKTPTKFIALLSGAAFLMSSAFAQGVTTDPVGYVTMTVNATSDARVSVPLFGAATYSGAASSVTAGVITVSGDVPDVTTAAHFVWVTSNAPVSPLTGKWYAVDSATATTITVSEDLGAAGLVAGDTFHVVPFWTLDTLLPGGGGVPLSSDVFAPVGQLLFNDVTAQGVNLAPAGSYLYHDGAQGPAGWYDVNNVGGGLAGGTVVSPETYITVRNGTGLSATLTFAGTVPTLTFANDVVSRSAGPQDSQIPNPFPADVTFSASNLVTSGALRASSNVFAPLDQLLLFAASPTGYNPSPVKSVLYHDGAQGPAGWYDVNNIGGGLIDSDTIPAGAALVVRRAAGTDAVYSWAPTVPYSLD